MSIHQLNEQIAKSHDVMRLASEAHEADLIEREVRNFITGLSIPLAFSPGFS